MSKLTIELKVHKLLTANNIEMHHSISLKKYTWFVTYLLAKNHEFNQINEDTYYISQQKNCVQISHKAFRKKFGYFQENGKKIYIGNYILNQFIFAKLIKLYKNYSNSESAPFCKIYEISDRLLYAISYDLSDIFELNGLVLTKDTVRVINKDDLSKKIFSDKSDKETESEIVNDLLTILNKCVIDINENNLTHLEKGSQHRMICLANRVINFNYGEHFVSVSDKTGRVYTDFSQLDRETRKNVKMVIKDKKGKIFYSPLSSIDMKACQPYLLSYIFKDSEYSKVLKNEDIYLYLIEKLKEFNIDELMDTIGYIKWHEETYGLCFDINNEPFIKENYKEIYSRNGMKLEFYRFLFSKNMNKMNVVDRLVERIFPDLHKQIKTYKKGGNNLAVELQKKESEIFINVWTKCKEYSIPLHDAIYYPKNNERLKDYEKKVKNKLENRLNEMGYKDYTLCID